MGHQGSCSILLYSCGTCSNNFGSERQLILHQKSHDTKVDVESQDGQNETLIVDLPKIEPPDEAEYCPDPDPIPGCSKN